MQGPRTPLIAPFSKIIQMDGCLGLPIMTGEVARGILRVDKTTIAAAWAARGFSCELWTDPPGQRWEDFRHQTDELVIVLEGEMEFEIAGRVEHPQAGEEL